VFPLKELVDGGAVQFKDFKMVNNHVGVEIKLIKEGDYYDTTGPLLMNTFILGSTSFLQTEMGSVLLNKTHKAIF
jgi:hypothetical protein